MLRRIVPLSGRILLMLLVVAVLPFLPLVIAWRWDWWEAWVYGVICIGGFAVSRAMVAWCHPDLLAERARFMRHENAKRWDRFLAPAVALGAAVTPVAAGFDARLDGSAPFGPAVKVVSLVLMAAGFALGTYAMVENRFFSGMVRIQTDRGHRVVSSGPYRWMRHPGYAGAILAYLATPFFLDSLWALLPAVLLAIVLVIRTALEDRVLRQELAGYDDYAKRVRYRLMPGAW